MEHRDQSDDLYTQRALYLGMAANDHDRRQDDLAIRRTLHAQDLFSRLGDPVLSARSGFHLGYYFLSANLFDQATEMIQGGIDAASSSGDRTLQFQVRYDLAILYLQRQEYSRADLLARAAYEQAVARGSLRFVVDSATLLAELAEEMGEHEAAAARWLEAGYLCERIGLGLRAGQVWQRLGMLLSKQGDLEEGRRFIQQSREYLRRYALPPPGIAYRR